jgi:hypothetical protein
LATPLGAQIPPPRTRVTKLVTDVGSVVEMLTTHPR